MMSGWPQQGWGRTSGRTSRRTYGRALAAVLVSVLLLAGCSGGSGAPNSVQLDLTASAASANARALTYSGPAPVTTDVQQFKVNVWDNLAAPDRCGSCHQQGGVGTGAFVRDDDINLAYATANGLVDPRPIEQASHCCSHIAVSHVHK